MLFDLGLKNYPDPDVICRLCAHEDYALRQKAFEYMQTLFKFKDFRRKYKILCKQKQLPAFVPARSDVNSLCTPDSIYEDGIAGIIGFNVVAKEVIPFCDQLLIEALPSISDLVDALTRDPLSERNKATTVFEFLADNLTEITAGAKAKLSLCRIVPLFSDQDKFRHFELASECYFMTDEKSQNGVFHKIFPHVDFGWKANTFLRYLGVSSSPSARKIAEKLGTVPLAVYKAAGSVDKYKDILKIVADNFSTIKLDRNIFGKLRDSAFLLGVQSGNNQIDTVTLEKSSDIIIADNIIDFELFKSGIKRAPDDCESCQEMYKVRNSLLLPTTFGLWDLCWVTNDI